MQVQKIQNNNNYNTNFKAEIVDTAALRVFKSGLSKRQKTIFDSYVSTIKGSKDKHKYIFEYIQILNPKKGKKLATISVQKRDKTIVHPAMFTDDAKNGMKLFEKLAQHCESYEK